jgi:MOSC domain-containing protein YiiM
MPPEPTLLWLNTGVPARLPLPDGETVSAIVKTPTMTPLALGTLGLEGDHQVDRRVHGGPDKAVCVYPYEHYAHWERRLSAVLTPGAFGENFTTGGLVESEVCIGDTWAVDDAVVQVSQPRTPCFRLAARHGEPALIKWVITTGFSGFYLRVLEPGTVGPNASIRALSRPSPGATIALANRIVYGRRPKPEETATMLEAEGLAHGWRGMISQRLGSSTRQR